MAAGAGDAAYIMGTSRPVHLHSASVTLQANLSRFGRGEFLQAEYLFRVFLFHVKASWTMASFAACDLTLEFKISQPSMDRFLEGFSDFLMAFQTGLRSDIFSFRSRLYSAKRGIHEEDPGKNKSAGDESNK